MATEEKSIKETLELLEGLKLLSTDYSKVMEDGKVDLKDLGVATDLFMQFADLKAAFSDLGEIPKEAKDLSKEELLQIVEKVYEIVGVFKKK